MKRSGPVVEPEDVMDYEKNVFKLNFWQLRGYNFLYIDEDKIFNIALHAEECCMSPCYENFRLKIRSTLSWKFNKNIH